MESNKRVAIVTGAGRGIGLGIAMKLASELGLKIVVVDIDETTMADAVEQIKALGDDKDAIAVKCDVSSADDVESMVSAAFEFGDVEVVVNNAGITKDSMLLKMEEKDWDLVQNINLKSMFLICKAVCSRWVESAKQKAAEATPEGEESKFEPSFYAKKHIINISSIVAKGGNIGQANYTASKAGVIAMTKTIAKEMARYNINANCIQPGFVKTPMTDKMPEKVIIKFVEQIPLGRMGLPEDIAGAVKFLASVDSDYVTGISIEVAGGLNM
ncbi:MAG TPA: SDR family oxidoreductase [Candidatus Lokiarchaeia archaeon]|nr:SDR family oxidoreductase [Candidatus Lokiarchaeia archaeon]